MVTNGSSFFTVPDLPPLDRGGPEAGPIVVWLWGDHDASTDSLLCLTLARAIAFDRARLVLDLSKVGLMGASTLGVIVRAREFLRQRSRSLTVRSRSLTVRAPSASARRVMDACGLNDLLGPSPEMAVDMTGQALGSWVAVPAVERSDGRPGQSAVVPTHVPEHLGCTSALEEQVLRRG
jgi:anti-anti-sigma factor